MASANDQRARLSPFVLLVAAAAVVGVVCTASTIQRKPVPYEDRLKWYANEAKNKGQQKVRVPGPLIEYLGDAGTISVEEAFSYSTVVVAQLVSKQSTYSDADITTWNKFAIDETLSEAKHIMCPGCVLPSPPATLLPLSAGEFLLPKTGGTANIDGVEVQQFIEDYPEYELNQKYVLLITLYAWALRGHLAGLSVSLRFFRTTNLHQSVRANIRFAKISKTCLAIHLIK